MKIDELPLPIEVKRTLKRIGYRELYPPQEEAIKRGLFKGKNLVVATPTASGKTFIAILLTIYNWVNGRKGKTIYLVPLKALANEKYNEFRDIFSKLPIKKPVIRISTGDYDSKGEELRHADVIIATYEKMDSLLRHSPSWMYDISTVIIDETHLIGSPDRGGVVENIITRLLTEGLNLQILMLSATISNIKHFEEWIEGEAININWRPVPLKEGVLYNHEIYYDDGEIGKIKKYIGDPILDKILETIFQGGQVLVFVHSRNEAKRRAKKISRTMQRFLTKLYTDDEIIYLDRLAQKILDVGEKTKLSEELSNVVRYGVAFHHAGLGINHRSLIEESFRDGYIKILTATPTLAAGVNLPSRTVIITYTSRRIAGFYEPINVFDYKQMAGRAGRPQYDEFGEALVYTSNQWNIDYIISNYIQGEIEPIMSSLLEGENMEVTLLSLISSVNGIDMSKLKYYISKTLAYIQYPEKRVVNRMDIALKRLSEYGMIDIVESGDKTYFIPTSLGKRTSELYILPSTGRYFYIQFRKPMGIQTDFELLYHLSHTKDMITLNVRKKDISRILSLMEVEDYLSKYIDAIYNPFSNSIYDIDETSVIKTALVLYDWINERTEEYIRENWGVEPGDLYALYTTAEWLAYSASEIAIIAGNMEISRRYKILSQRIRYGVKEELVSLTQIPDIGRRRARLLYKHGYKTLYDLKQAELKDLVSIPGIGTKLAQKIMEEVKKLFQ